MIFTLISIVANLIIILACLISDIGLQFHQQWLSLSFENTLFFKYIQWLVSARGGYLNNGKVYIYWFHHTFYIYFPQKNT